MTKTCQYGETDQAETETALPMFSGHEAEMDVVKSPLCSTQN